MWFKYTIYSLCVALCLGAPQGSEPGSEDGSSSPIPIIAQDDTVEDNGTRHFSYETGNGIKVEESSYTKKVPHLAARVGGAPGPDDDKEEDEVLVLTGSFSYTAPDGTLISLRYIADENGFQPIGEHLPTSPPIPEAILKSLQNLPPDNEIEDGAPAQGDK